MNIIIRRQIFRILNWVSRHFFASRLSFSHIQAFLFNNSFKKFFNFLHVHWSMHQGHSIVTCHPYLFVLEVTNVCNLKCPFCLTGKGISGNREVRHMKFEEAKKILDEVGPYLYFLQVYTWGEPLLNKDLIKIIKYAKQKNIYVMLSTNATAMTHEYNKSLLEAGIDYIMLAIDGGSENTYKQYRRGGDFNKVLANVNDLLSQCKHQATNTPFIEWQYIVFRHNEHEIKTTEKMAYEIGINKFTPLPAYVENKDWLPENPEYRTDLGNPERLFNCDRPWSHLNVRADGGVASCCYTFFKKDDFSSFVDHSFHQIWNNEKFQQSRRIIWQSRKKTPLEQSEIACYNCMKTGVRPSFIEISNENA
ncbi:radical SAM/SPASM domain-containing protein [Methylobacter marinus]|uniref:radical SAM/SPASM domain-containing protein n=1 Tax=Methylobacter marinus TaxID=34058 RepID=UPI00039DFC60|nr:radical SAM protein [Methylobacter marinus]